MKNKDKILNIVGKSECGISAKQVFDKVSWDMDKTTVYRNLEKLSLEWKINEDFSSNGERQYSNKDHHHHHFVCNDCWNQRDIGCFLSQELQKLEKKEKISITNHSFVLNGHCGDCNK